MRKALIVLFVSILGLTSCLRRDDFSEIPVIQYEEMYQVDRSLVVRFSFTDGNGDIGLRDNQLSPPFGPCDEFYKNLIVDPYRLDEGEFVLARKIVPSDCSPDSITLFDTVGYDQRIKYIEIESTDNTLEGDIEVTLNEVLDEFPSDTIKFKLILMDRALNFSNEIETDVIITP